MSNSVALFFLLFFFQGSEVPYKPFDEFEIQVDFQFKQRPGSGAASTTTIDYQETAEEQTKKKYGSGLRPYLILNVNLIKLSDQEVKVRAVNNVGRVIITKKVKTGDMLKLDMGFMDDIKDRVGPYEVTMTFLSPEKKEASRILLFVEEDGTFLVNGELRGKF